MNPKKQEENAAQVPPCPYLGEDGKHHFLPAEHRKGYKFWVEQCPHCGWIDTEKIYNEVESQAIKDEGERMLGLECMKEEEVCPPSDGLGSGCSFCKDNQIRNQLRLEIKHQLEVEE